MRPLGNFFGLVTSLSVLLLVGSCSCANPIYMPTPSMREESTPLTRAVQSSLEEEAATTGPELSRERSVSFVIPNSTFHSTQGAGTNGARETDENGVGNATSAGSNDTDNASTKRRTKLVVCREIMNALYELTEVNNPETKNFVVELNQELSSIEKVNRDFPFVTLASLKENAALSDNNVALLSSMQQMQGLLNEAINNAVRNSASANSERFSFLNQDQLNKKITFIKAKLAELELAEVE